MTSLWIFFGGGVGLCFIFWNEREDTTLCRDVYIYILYNRPMKLEEVLDIFLF